MMSPLSAISPLASSRVAPFIAARFGPYAFSRFASTTSGRPKLFPTLSAKVVTPRSYLQSLRFASDECKGKPTVVAEIDYMNLPEESYELSHHLHTNWTKEELVSVKVEHTKPVGFLDWAAYGTVRALRFFYDLFTGYMFGKRDEMCFIRRIIILETVAGVPGMIGAMVRHLNSLRRMKRDYGWIHTLLEEAENERMHLMSCMLLLEKPSFLIRWTVLAGQWGFMLFYTLMYLTSPKYCHRLVGYIEEEAVKTYTAMIEKMENGKLPGLDIPAHETMRAYWRTPDNATLKDIIYYIRADESHHREVNHTFASMKHDECNPFQPGY